MPSHKNLLHLIKTSRLDILTQLHLEESLFRSTSKNWLLVNDGVATPAVVLGISGKPAELVHDEKAKVMGVPLIKRFTGGGTVVVDENSVMTSLIVGPGVCEDVKRFPRAVMDWTHGVLFGDSCGSIGLVENDFTIGARKIGGNAQAISGQRFLQHTSFLWDYRESLMELLKEPVKRPAYRGDRAHQGFVTTLQRESTVSDLFGSVSGCERESFVDGLVARCVAQGGWSGVVQVELEEGLRLLEAYRSAKGRQVLLGSAYIQ